MNLKMNEGSIPDFMKLAWLIIRNLFSNVIIFHFEQSLSIVSVDVSGGCMCL